MNDEKEIEVMQNLINSRFCVGWDDNSGCTYSSNCDSCRERFKEKARDIAWFLEQNGYGNVSEANQKIKQLEHAIDNWCDEVHCLQLQVNEVKQQTAKKIFDLLEKLEKEGRAVLPKGFLISGKRAYGLERIEVEKVQPYKVGDTLYFVRDGKVIECTISELKCMASGEWKMQIEYITNIPYGDYRTVEDAYMADIGTKYFTDKEQAQARIKGVRNEREYRQTN